MTFGTLFKHICIVGIVLSTYTMQAHQDGITGLYQNGCGACHGGAANNATQLSLTGSASVKAGAQETYTFRVANANKTAAGFNLAILSGAGAKQSDLAGANGIQLFDGELTHTQPKGFTNGGADFQFKWTAPAAHGTYTLYAAGNAVNENQANSGDVWNTFSKTLTVTGATITGPPAGQAYCVGETISITWTQTGITNIKIDLSKDNFTTVTTVVASVAANAGTYAYTIPTDLTSSSNYAFRLINTATGDELAKSMLFTISGAPTVATQPEDQSICLGRTLQIVAGGSGKTPTYQWRHNGNVIPGATEAIYRIPTTTADDAGEYDCVITACTQQVTTRKAVVTMMARPAITAQTSGNKNLCEGDNLSLSVTATGDGLIYEWYKNGAVVIGATGPTLDFNGITIGNEGTYRCRVSGLCNPADTSDAVVVDVLEKPLVTGQPSDAALKAGAALTLTVGASGDQLSYQWLKNGVVIQGADDANYAVTAVAMQDSGSYQCRVYNQCDTVLSRIAKVTVAPADGPGKLTLSTDTIRVGTIGQCAGKDTLVSAFLTNTGGLPITISAVSTEQPEVVQVLSLVLPLELAPGATHDVRLVITPQTPLLLEAGVSFTSNGGNASVAIVGDVESNLHFDRDTLVLVSGVVGSKQCTESLTLPCPSATVSDISISGPGASTYTIDPPIALPLAIPGDGSFTLCIVTKDEAGGSARVTVSSTAGNATVELLRREASGVEETGDVIPGLTVAPNPMDEYVTITLPTDAATHIEVYTVLGARVQVLDGYGTLRWDGTDTLGNRVKSGLYVLAIRHGNQVAMERVLLR